MVEHMECPRVFLGKLVPEHFFSLFFFPLRTALCWLVGSGLLWLAWCGVLFWWGTCHVWCSLALCNCGYHFYAMIVCLLLQAMGWRLELKGPIGCKAQGKKEHRLRYSK